MQKSDSPLLVSLGGGALSGVQPFRKKGDGVLGSLAEVSSPFICRAVHGIPLKRGALACSCLCLLRDEVVIQPTQCALPKYGPELN
jgi:hypothetical protein